MPRADIPEQGYFKRRLVKDGPWVPVSIAFSASQEDRSPIWVATLNGAFVDVWDVWPDCSGEPITETEYRYLMSLREWAQQVPSAPEANPRQSINHHSLKPIF